MIRLSQAAAIAASAGVAFAASNSFAAGFEKSVMWGAESAGKAGIAAPYIQGSDAIYFNPAGLVTAKPGQSLGVNVSPTSAQFEGVINNTNDKVSSDRSLTFPFGLTYGYSEADWGIGVGAFVSGGNNVEYKDVSFGPGYKPSVKTMIQLIELSAGGAYRVNDKLKLGLGWRVAMAQADFAFVTRTSTPTVVANTTLSGLKDTQALAFRAGAQYKLDDATELGLTFRSEVNFDVKGKAQATAFSSASGAVVATGAENDATAHTTFPMMIALSGLHHLNENWDLLAQYDWIQYSRVGELVVDSTTFATTGNQTRLKTDWRDQHTIRLAAEYKTPWPVRFGYIYSTAVTNPDYARPTFTAPGPGQAISVGTGRAFGNDLRVDGALEYTWAKGEVTGQAASGTSTAGTDIRNGDYMSSAYVAHLGLTWMF
jgi:long-chain fatty acid transport protein